MFWSPRPGIRLLGPGVQLKHSLVSGCTWILKHASRISKSEELVSEKLERAGTVDFKKTPRTEGRAKVLTQGSRQVCLPRCPKSYNLQHFVTREEFSSDFPGTFLRNPRTEPGNSHSLLELKNFLLWVIRGVKLLIKRGWPLGRSTVTVRPNGITDRKIIFELIMHFTADAYTDENYFGIYFRSRCRHSCSLQFWGGGHSR